MPRPSLLILLVFLAIPGPRLAAQEGDRSGETQTNVLPRELIPLAPVLPPDQALASLRLPPGFRAEIVAAEPLIHDPVQIQFDPAGRLYVLEMRGYMPDPQGTGEFEKVGSVALLEDTDRDGRMDRRTLFLDQLVMPRAIGLAGDGLLVAEPPRLWFCRDTNGDGRADEKELVASDYATQADPKLGARANPEHASNGLLRAIDNWIYSANHTVRFRYFDGAFQREPTAFRGQWGISQDDQGRLFYNSNEDPLRADLVPSAYLVRNPYYRRAAGVNVQLYEDKVVWPARVNPGVNRGYRKGQLRPDGRLATFTAACAPHVYRGHLLPADVRGAVFVCEPSANLIRRYHLDPDGVSFKARNAHPQSEFLASTDERFRPVHLADGPDGALYVVDFYRGLIQHRIYLTTYLRNQILDRNLHQPIGLGRIYRIVPDTPPPRTPPDLAAASPAHWVATLSHPNGWHRDTAQRLLVDTYAADTADALRQVVAAGPTPVGRLHALWTLEGLRQLTEPVILTALRDRDPALRAAALRLGESFFRAQPAALARAIELEADPVPAVQLQLALTLGSVPAPQAEATMARIAHRHAANPFLRDALLSGLAGRELALLQQLLASPDWHAEDPGRRQFLAALAQCTFASANATSTTELLSLAANRPPPLGWQRLALLDGMLKTIPVASRGTPPPKRKPIRLPSQPPAIATLQSLASPDIDSRLATLLPRLSWPGKPGDAWPEVPPLTGDNLKRFELGRQLFSASCAACHQPHGFGQEGLAPPLVDSEWVLGSPARTARILLHGLHGPITVNGERYDLDMPAFGLLDDEQLASILTFIRREWGHDADPVPPETVSSIRRQTAGREEAWTEAELLRLP